MTDGEGTVRTVLAGLRDVEAPAGMERRVLLAMEGRVAARAARRWTWGRLPFAFGAVLAFGLALVVFAVHRQEPVARARLAGVSAAAVVAPVASGLVNSSPARAVRLPMARRAGVRRADAAGVLEALALREMRAPSQVAPPLPLTVQEKLLLQVAHRGEPAELAMLDPEMRRKQEMEAKVEFQQFFEPAMTTTTTKENR